MIFRKAADAVNYIANTEFIGYDESFDLSKYCSVLLRTKDEENHGRDIVIRIKDAWNKLHEHTKPIWNDLTEAAGLYPYVEPEHLSRSAMLRYE